eukprot:6212189-Pleurochrysis_carterae.AAC.2
MHEEQHGTVSIEAAHASLDLQCGARKRDGGSAGFEMRMPDSDRSQQMPAQYASHLYFRHSKQFGHSIDGSRSLHGLQCILIAEQKCVQTESGHTQWKCWCANESQHFANHPFHTHDNADEVLLQTCILLLAGVSTNGYFVANPTL